MMEQFDALVDGVIDIQEGPASHYEPRIPEVGAMGINSLTPKEERESGFYDFMNERYNEAGAYYLGRMIKYKPFHIFSSVPVEKMADFAKLKISGQGSYHLGFVERLGAAAVSIPHTDVYSAMERGLVDACCYEPSSFYFSGLYEVADYVIMPEYKKWDNTALIMNLDSWNSLPEHLQKLIIDVMISIEGEALSRDYGLWYLTLEQCKAKGLKVIELPEADVETFTSLYTEVGWDIVKEGASAENYNKLRELTAK